MSYQKVVIVGNLGRDPEFRYLDTNNNSTAVANFNVATNRQYTASSGERVTAGAPDSPHQPVDEDDIPF